MSRHEKTGFLLMRKQKTGAEADQRLCFRDLAQTWFGFKYETAGTQHGRIPWYIWVIIKKWSNPCP